MYVTHIAIIGPPSAGKSEIASRLEKEARCIKYSKDWVAEEILGYSWEDRVKSKTANQEIDTKLTEFKNSALAKGSSVLTDTTAYTNEERRLQVGVPKDIINYLSEKGKELKRYLVGINVEWDELLRRNKEKGRTSKEACEGLRESYSIWNPPTDITDNNGTVIALNYDNNTPEDLDNIQRELSALLNQH